VRLGDAFVSVYGSSAAGRRAPTRLELPAPPPDAPALPWFVRATDVDRLGHMNNAAYWALVEELWGGRLAVGAHLLLEYRQPIDRAEEVVVASSGDGLWLTVDGEVRAAAAILSA
jgi:acyl-ACP thioesterase